jgi:hypothetical protein
MINHRVRGDRREERKNTKSENRNTKQIQNPNVRMTKTIGVSRFGNLKFWKFGFVTDFEIRASNFNTNSASFAVAAVKKW